MRLRERDRIGDEVLARMLRETDLTARAAEGDALPGAGSPNPLAERVWPSDWVSAAALG